MEHQKTIAREASFSGIGLHTGNLTTLTFKPAPPDSGITFYRCDLPDRPAIKADVDNVVDVTYGTTIGVNGVKVHTVEHVLAAIAGLGLDNLHIDVDASETPVGDGSAVPFMNTLQKAGFVEQHAERKFIRIKQPVYYKNEDVTLSVLPSDELRVTMTIAFDHVAIGTQYASYIITPDTFAREIAPARTFGFLRDAKMLQEQGLIKGVSLENAVAIGDESILNEELRFPDEFVRHKILDLLGDMYLLGRPVKGHVIGVKSGHASHVKFSQEVKKSLTNGRAKRDNLSSLSKMPAVLDVNMIMKVLPHRFPFLLVDRILSFVPFERVVGIKNVTVNEPYFQGHWPSMPVMPGVLIIESMAQVSSVLIFHDNSLPGKVAIFLGIDRAKFRRTVVPGDQLILEAEMIQMRRNACKVKACAKIGDSIVAEAIMLFGLMDAPLLERTSSAKALDTTLG
ncbi:MAG: bifunctional UDP-3-O-[3-hydroxymyristoyl] N-acetylglucosamine deacetylase/3-hydroxyacyl-ACP dehydratase [Candidatus Hydrogenedentes bacterium]|nr:bifunctional UDP-3-O-[3-hydroxymyristoyl] N-acetylglucosamine deacetylase/3-hydroxyacyl-ACP dehydratase [Candidatus Hydrogenedentota bacterium]